MRTVNLKWVNIHAYHFFVSGPKFTKCFAEPSRDHCRSSLFPIFDTSTGSWNIRGQSWKLSEIM